MKTHFSFLSITLLSVILLSSCSWGTNSLENGGQNGGQNGVQGNVNSSQTATGNTIKKEGEATVTTTESGSVLKVMINGLSTEIDTGAKEIKNIETINDTIVYDWIGPIEPVKKIYDKKTKQSIAGIPNGKLSDSKEFIYVCLTQTTSSAGVRVYDIKNQAYFDLYSELYLANNSTVVTSCEFDDANKTIAFSTSNGANESKNYLFKYENNTFNEIK